MRKTWRSTIAGIGLTAAFTVGIYGAEIGQPDTLYDRLGGMPAIQAVVDDLIPRILADPRVNKWFAHAAADPERAAAYKANLANLLCLATGGPCKYTGQDMLTAHQGRGVTPEAFDAVVNDIVATLDKLKVPETGKQQLLAILAPLKPLVVQQ